MKATKQKRTFSLTNTFQSHLLGTRISFLFAFSATLATLIFLLLMGPIGNPDFWHITSLVNLFANLMMWYVVAFVAISPFAFSWHFFLSSVDAAVILTTDSFTDLHPSSLRRLLHRLRRFVAGISTAFRAQITQTQHQLRALIALQQRRPPRHRPKSKAPFLLFGQAPPLLAP